MHNKDTIQFIEKWIKIANSPKIYASKYFSDIRRLVCHSHPHRTGNYKHFIDNIDTIQNIVITKLPVIIDSTDLQTILSQNFEDSTEFKIRKIITSIRSAVMSDYQIFYTNGLELTYPVPYMIITSGICVDRIMIEQFSYMAETKLVTSMMATFIIDGTYVGNFFINNNTKVYNYNVLKSNLESITFNGPYIPHRSKIDIEEDTHIYESEEFAKHYMKSKHMLNQILICTNTYVSLDRIPIVHKLRMIGSITTYCDYFLNLTELVLDKVSWSGEFGKMPNLVVLGINGCTNQLYTCPNLSGFLRLEYLTVKNINIDKLILPESILTFRIEHCSFYTRDIVSIPQSIQNLHIMVDNTKDELLQLSPLWNNLIELKLIGAAIDTSIVSGFTILKDLHLESCKLLDLEDSFLSNCKDLTTVTITQCFEKCDKVTNLFTNLSTIKTLNLSNNNINSINLSGMVGLKYLDLSYNDLISIPDNQFKDTKNLEYVSFKSNKGLTINNTLLDQLRLTKVKGVIS